MSDSADVTDLLVAWSAGDETARSRLIDAVYNELRGLARGYLRRERADHSLAPTALVHEAYLKLIDQRQVRWQNRGHFFAIAAHVMRRILVDHARTRGRQKRGGPDAQRVPLELALNAPIDLRMDFERLDEALTALGVHAPDKARVVELRYFAGLSIQATADVMDISPATVKRHWEFARAWLYRALKV